MSFKVENKVINSETPQTFVAKKKDSPVLPKINDSQPNQVFTTTNNLQDGLASKTGFDYSTFRRNSLETTFITNNQNTEERLPKTIVFTADELGIVTKGKKLPAQIQVGEQQFEQKLFAQYGLDINNPNDKAIIQKVYGNDKEPADNLDWINTKTGKKLDNLTATLRPDGNYEVTVDLLKATNDRLSNASFNKLFFPNQANIFDFSSTQTLSSNAKTGEFQKTADDVNLTDLALDMTQMGLDIVGIFEPTPFADLTNAGISAVRGEWGNAALSVLGVIPYVGDLGKLGKIPKWLSSIEKITTAVGKLADVAIQGGKKGKEVAEAFIKQVKGLLDKIPLDKVPEAVKDALSKLKQKVDEFFAKTKKADDNIVKSEKIDDVGKTADNTKPTKTDGTTSTKQPDVEPPQKPNQSDPNNSPKTPQTTKTDPTDWNKNGTGLGNMVEQALKRKDLDADTLKSIDNSLSELNDALKNGRLENTGAMRDLISNLGKADPKQVSESLAELERASQVLKSADIAPNTKVIIGAREGQQLTKTGLPDIDVPKVEADIYFKTKDGKIHLNEVKDTFNALTSKIDDGIKATKKGNDPKQFERYGEWVKKGADAGETREVLVVVRKSGPGFDSLLETNRINELAKTVGGNLDKPILQVGNRTFSVNQLKQIRTDALTKLGELIKNNPNKKAADLAKEYFGSIEKTIQTLGKEIGTQVVK